MAACIGEVFVFSEGSSLVFITRAGEVNKVRAHKDRVTCLQSSQGKLYAGSLDGKISTWEDRSYSLKDTGEAIIGLAIVKEVAYIVRKNAKEIVAYNMGTEQSSVLLEGVMEEISMIAGSPGRLIAAGGCEVAVYDLVSEASWKFNHSIPVTAICPQPSGTYIAMGDSAGQILKIYSANQSQRMHWHAHKVSWLGFTPDENFLLSGGEEGVLVLWHEGTGRTTFLARLGAAVMNFAAGIDRYAVKTMDNVVKIYDSSYKLIHEHRGLTNPNKVLPGAAIYTGLVPHDDVIYLTGAPGHLQCYDTITKVIRTRQVNERNPMSRIDNDYPIPLQVTQVAFAGSTMATLESNLQQKYPISYLKFWTGYKLATIILNPHENRTCKLIASKTEYITLGADGTWILWREEDGIWNGVLRQNFHNLKPVDGCFGRNSRIHVAFENMIVSYDKDYQICSTFVEPNRVPFERLVPCGKYIVATTAQTLYVLLKSLVQYTWEVGTIVNLAADAKHFVLGARVGLPELTTTANILVKFSPTSATPLSMHKTRARTF